MFEIDKRMVFDGLAAACEIRRELKSEAGLKFLDLGFGILTTTAGRAAKLLDINQTLTYPPAILRLWEGTECLWRRSRGFDLLLLL